MIIIPEAMMSLTPSDIVLLIDFVLAFVVAAYFALGSPRTWVHDALGWVIFGYAVVTAGLLFLIVWGIVFGQKIDEWVRFVFAFAFGLGLIAKGLAMYDERRKGRIARDQYTTPEGRSIMSNPTPTVEEVKEATTIWYKTQRVLRTVFATLVSFLTAWAVFSLAAPQILAELAQILPGPWIAWLTAVIATVTTVAGVLTRIMAIPAVNAFLTKIGLGSVPKSAVYKSPRNGRVIVKADEKAVNGG